MQTVNLKLNKDKCHFRCTSVISRHGERPDPWKLKAPIKMSPKNEKWTCPPKMKKELQVSLGMINYLSKFSPITADIFESLRQLISVKTEWTWNAIYQKLFDKAKSIITEDACMKFYDEIKPLYLETDASAVGLGAGLLQKRHGTSYLRDEAPDNSVLMLITFSSKSLSRAEKRYSNIAKEALGILYRLKNIHHYCFAREMSIITNHKPLVAIFRRMK